MSSPATSLKSKPGTTFLWVLGAFAGFAVLFSLIQFVAGYQRTTDLRAADRTAFRAEIDKAQGDLVTKMGVSDPTRRIALFTKTVETLQNRKAGVSTQVVPGSPTQLKQAAAAAPAPAAPAAPAPATPAATPAPATPTTPPAVAPAAPAATPAATPAPAAPTTPPAAAPTAPAPATPAAAPAPAAPTSPAAPAAPAPRAQ